MAVKRIRGASRALDVLEAIAAQQPVNVAALARHLGENKSNLQRVLMTLADDGWIRAVQGTPTRWELTARIFGLVDKGQGHSDLRHLARSTLDRLRNETGESVFLAVPDRERLITIDVLESNELVRTVPYVGMIIPPRDSAAGRAVLAHMATDAQAQLLGQAPDPALLDSEQARYESLERLVRQRVLATAANKLNLFTTDQRLARELQQNQAIAALRKPDGTLDVEAYRQLLARQTIPALRHARETSHYW